MELPNAQGTLLIVQKEQNVRSEKVWNGTNFLWADLLLLAARSSKFSQHLIVVDIHGTITTWASILCEK